MSAQITNYNPNINPGTSGGGSSATTSDDKSNQELERAKQQRQELQERITRLEESMRAAESNARIGMKDMKKDSGFWSWASGLMKSQEKDVDADLKHLNELRNIKTKLQEDLKRTDELIQKGQIAEARKQAEKSQKEALEKQKSASQNYASDVREAGKDIQSAEKFLGRTETAMKYTRDGCVIVGATIATIATGGAAGAGFLTAAGAGTATGTGIGLLSNTAKAGMDIHYGKDTSQALSEAWQQTKQDFKTSAITGLSAGAAGKVSTAIIGKGAEAATATAATRILAGRAAGGMSSAVSNVANTIEGKISGTDNRGIGEMAWDLGVDTAIGIASGDIGARSGMAQGVKQQLAARGGEFLFTGTSGVAGSYLKEGKLTEESFKQNFLNATQSAIIGELSTRTHDQGPHKSFRLTPEEAPPVSLQLAKQKPPVPREKNDSHTVGEAAPVAGGAAGLIPKQKPPVPEHETASPQSGQPQKPPVQEPKVVQVPENIKNDPAYKRAQKGGLQEPVVDNNLPPGVDAQTEVVIYPDGRIEKRIKISSEVAGGLKETDTSSPHSKNEWARRVLNEEVAHSHQSVVDPVKPDGTVMSKEEYLSRRAFRELVAEDAGHRKNGTKVDDGNVLTEMRRLIDAGDYEGANKIARSVGALTKQDEKIFTTDYEHNKSADREKLVQRSNATEEESGTAVLDRPKGKGGNGEVIQSPGRELLTGKQIELAEMLNESLESCKKHAEIVKAINEGMGDAQENRFPARYEKDARDFLKSRGYHRDEINEIIDGAKNQKPDNGELTTKNNDTENLQPKQGSSKTEPEHSNGNGKPKRSSNEEIAQELADKWLEQFLEDAGNATSRVAFETNDEPLLNAAVAMIDESKAGVKGQLPAMTKRITGILDELTKGSEQKRNLIKGTLDPVNGSDEFGKNLLQLEKLSELSKKGVAIPDELLSKPNDPSTSHFIDTANEYHKMQISSDRRKSIDDFSKKHFGDMDYDKRIELVKLLETDAKLKKLDQEPDKATRKRLMLEHTRDYLDSLDNVLDNKFFNSDDKRSQALDILKSRTKNNDVEGLEFLENIAELSNRNVEGVDRLFDDVLKNKDAGPATREADKISGTFTEARVAKTLDPKEFKVLRVGVRDDGNGKRLVDGNGIDREFDIVAMRRDGTIYNFEVKTTGNALYDKNFFKDTGRPKSNPQAVALVNLTNGKKVPGIIIERPKLETGQFKDEVIKVRQLVHEKTGHKLQIFDKFGNNITSNFPIPQD